MILTLLIIFFVGLALIAHTYLFYPLFMILRFKEKKNVVSLQPPSDLPAVSILIAAYNEEKVIKEKLQSVLMGNYPSHLLTIYVGSDASSDKTDELVSDFAVLHPNVKLLRFEDRGGKTSIINRLQLAVKDELLILTDANVFFTPDTIGLLVAAFRDETIGLVAANIIKTSEKNEGISLQEKKYLSLENQLKSAESKAWGFIMGAEGGCYAMRSNLFTKIPDNFIVDDFYLTLQVLAKDKNALFCEEALCYEDVAGDAGGEFRRKVRISSGNFQNLFFFRKFLLPIWRPLAFSFWSHKVLRWLTPFLLIILLLVSAALASVYPAFLVLTVLQVVGIMLPLLNHYFKFKFEALRFISHFYLMNAALLMGFFRYSKGIKSSVWQPVNRHA